MRRTFGLSLVTLLACSFAHAGGPPPGFESLFNGKDFSGWKVPMGDNGHWKIINGVIDYDAKSEAKGEKGLISERSFKDYVLLVDFKCKLEPAFKNKNVPIIMPDGEHLKGPDGKEIKIEIDDVDSGIYIRGQPKAQVNIWMWPIGSGEVYGYRMDKKQPPEVRAGVTPKKRMDKPRGEWNTFEITVKGDRLWVKLNGEEVITSAQLPGLASEGPVVLQHHGGWNAKTNQWSGPPSIVQFRNIYVKDLSAPAGVTATGTITQSKKTAAPPVKNVAQAPTTTTTNPASQATTATDDQGGRRLGGRVRGFFRGIRGW